MNFRNTIFHITIVSVGLIILGIYLIWFTEQIRDSKEHKENTLLPCSIKYVFGAWGEECKEYILDKIYNLEQRIKELESK